MAPRKRPIEIITAFFSLIAFWCFGYPEAFAGSASSTLLAAKQEAEAKSYVFYTKRDEIVSRAKGEGKLRVWVGLEGSLKATAEAFRRKYPFIDLHVETLRTIDQSQRALLQVRANAAQGWDIAKTTPTLYSEWLPHLWKIDLLGMAEHGVLDIPFQMIDPNNRNVIALGGRMAVVVYNKNVLPPTLVPKSWEDMLGPEYKGRKFATDIHPAEIAGLVPAWGLEKTLHYARQIAAQEPIWSRGSSRSVTAVGTGEVPLLLFGASYAVATRAQRKDPLGVLKFTLLEPVPVRLTLEQAILSTSRHPHAALLWLEYMANSEAQRLIDEHEPLAASLYSKGSAAEQALKGKKVSAVSWKNNEDLEQWVGKLTEAYGFPKALVK